MALRRLGGGLARALVRVGLPAIAAGAFASALPVPPTGVEAFVPPGWRIEQRHAADLDGDGLPDVVLLLRQDDPQLVDATLNRNPRQLAVLQATRESVGYRLAGRSARLIPVADRAGAEDPLAEGEIVVRPGGFEVRLALVNGIGSYASRIATFAFRMEPGCVRLVRYLRMDTHRSTLATQDLKIDYLRGLRERATGNAQTDTQNIERERFTPPPRRCLESLPAAWEFEAP